MDSTTLGIIIGVVLSLTIVVSDIRGNLPKDPPSYYNPLFPWRWFRRTRR